MSETAIHPIDLADENGYRYKNDLENTLSNLISKIGFKKVKELKNRLLNYERVHSIEEYVQAGCEIIIIDYIIRNYEGFDYEPNYNGKKNPECSFVYEQTTINLEVKCPNFEKRKKQECSSGIHVNVVDRIPDFNSVKSDMSRHLGTCENSLNFIDRMDNKLKDYLISANSKFPKSNENNFNVLIVGLEIMNDFDEWYNYLFSRTGIFNSDEILKKEKYENVDAILFTNCRAGLINVEEFKDINIWHLENCFNIMFLIPSKANTKTGEFYFKYGIDIFGEYSRNFIQSYIPSLKKDVESNLISICDEQSIHINIISNYFDWLKRVNDNGAEQVKV